MVRLCPTEQKSFGGWGYCPKTLGGGPEEFCGGENIMMIVLAYFFIAAAAVIAASAIIGFFLTTLLIRFLQNVDRSIRLCRGKVPAFSAPHRLLRKLLSFENLA
jgi:hypothetical protein